MALNPARANALVGVGVVLLVGVAIYVVHEWATIEPRHRDLAADEARDRSGARPVAPTTASPPRPTTAPAGATATPLIEIQLLRIPPTAGRHLGVSVALDDRTWTLDDDASDARKDAVWAEVAAAIARRHEADPKATGAIRTSYTKSGAVPDAAVTRALDAFVAAGVTEVALGGPEAGTPR